MNANMEHIMRAMNQDVPSVKRILELNPGHPLLGTMKSLFDEDKEGSRLADYIEIVHGQALLTEGSPIKNPLKFTQMVSELMVSAK
ncbi:MAG: molecular chaperone HtpG, partial [Verrucomicrobiota bacterium]